MPVGASIPTRLAKSSNRHFPDELSLDPIQTRNALRSNNDPYPTPNVCGPFVIFPASHLGSAQSA